MLLLYLFRDGRERKNIRNGKSIGSLLFHILIISVLFSFQLCRFFNISFVVFGYDRMRSRTKNFGAGTKTLECLLSTSIIGLVIIA